MAVICWSYAAALHLKIDPAAANSRAIRCYGKVGFRPVGLMRQYERGPDGGLRPAAG